MDNPRVTERLTSTTFADWWRGHVTANTDHVAVVQKVQEESCWSSHYLFMTVMSAGIAVLGLLLSSPAVVIGAMLISPLMGPIMGIGFAIATFDSAELRRTATVLLLGVLLAIGFCALIVLLSPLKAVTSEIAARTRPNLFDFLVALFSGLAGSYAMIRGRHGTIVGVAIATAIMPPLAVVGFGLATWNTTVLLGSALLFFTNLMTIAVSTAVLARLYGFAGALSPRQTGLQATIVVVTLVALAVPLGISLKRIAWEALASRQAQEVLEAQFGPEARVDQVELDFDSAPIAVQATVFTPHYQARAEADFTRRLSGLLGRQVEAKVEQFRVGNGPRDAEASQVSAARSGVPDPARAQLAEHLALVAGTTPEEVLIDRTARTALVRAAMLPGADLRVYRALESRIATANPGWRIRLIPPILDLPRLSESQSPEERKASLETAGWAALRLHLPVLVEGAETEADRVAGALKATGAEARREPGRRKGVALRWALPGGSGESVAR